MEDTNDIWTSKKINSLTFAHETFKVNFRLWSNYLTKLIGNNKKVHVFKPKVVEEYFEQFDLFNLKISEYHINYDDCADIPNALRKKFMITDKAEIARMTKVVESYFGDVYTERVFSNPKKFSVSISSYIKKGIDVLLPLALNDFLGGTSGHLNAIYINCINKQIEIFEPHGFYISSRRLDSHYFFVQNALVDFFAHTPVLRDFEVLYIPAYFKFDGPQGEPMHFNRKTYHKRDSFCALHSLIYLYIRSNMRKRNLAEFLSEYYNLSVTMQVDWVDIVLRFANDFRKAH